MGSSRKKIKIVGFFFSFAWLVGCFVVFCVVLSLFGVFLKFVVVGWHYSSLPAVSSCRNLTLSDITFASTTQHAADAYCVSYDLCLNHLHTTCYASVRFLR